MSDETELIIDDLVEELVQELDQYDDLPEYLYDFCVETIRKSEAVLRDEVEHIWGEWAEEGGNEGGDHDISVVFTFSRAGLGGLSYVGNLQMWQGESWEEFPYRAIVLVPDPPAVEDGG